MHRDEMIELENLCEELRLKDPIFASPGRRAANAIERLIVCVNNLEKKVGP